MTSKNESSREKFEVWALKQGHDIKNNNGIYSDSLTAWAWYGWHGRGEQDKLLQQNLESMQQTNQALLKKLGKYETALRTIAEGNPGSSWRLIRIAKEALDD